MSGVKPVHLGRRFVRALWPGSPRAHDVGWVEGILEPGELALWRELPNHDRRYSIRVARHVQTDLAGTEYAGQSRWLAAALLHDVGKLDAGFGVLGRSVATVMGATAGRPRIDRWTTASGFRGRAARYLRHDERGAERIRAAGGRDEAARWALAHHHRDRWAASGVPAPVAEALEAADNA
jgi:CRISPR-associated nuclease/helicase Cas3-like protein